MTRLRDAAVGWLALAYVLAACPVLWCAHWADQIRRYFERTTP